MGSYNVAARARTCQRIVSNGLQSRKGRAMRNSSGYLLWALMFISMTGCVYANVTSPLAYRSPTYGDIDPNSKLGDDVTGESCSHVILGLVAWGDGGYGAAMTKARKSSNAKVIVDVTADYSSFNVLGVYQRGCTVVAGRAVQ